MSVFIPRCRARRERREDDIYWGRCDLDRGHGGDHILERGMDFVMWSTDTTDLGPSRHVLVNGIYVPRYELPALLDEALRREARVREQLEATLDRETALAGAPAVCCVCGAPATYRLGMPKPAWCDEHGPHARRAVPEHRPVLVEVTTGSLDDPERRETERVVQERCGCTDDLRHDYGHEKKGPKP